MPEQPERRFSVAFGSSVYQALHIAARHAYPVGAIVGTDDLVLALLGLHRMPDVCRMLVYAPLLKSPVPYRFSTGSGEDGRLPVGRGLDHSAEVEATIREVGWQVARLSRTAADRQPAWTNGLRVTLHEALAQAHDLGTTRVNAGQLILAAFGDPFQRASRMFPHSPERVVAQLRHNPILAEEGPIYPDPDFLAFHLGPYPRLRRRWARWAMRRMNLLTREGLLTIEVQSAQRRQAVRMRHHVITAPHLLLALFDVEHQLVVNRLALPADLAVRNTAVQRLRQCGLTFDQVHAYAARAGDDVELADPMVVVDRLSSARSGDPLWSASVIDAERGSVELARAHGHPDAGTTHLLAALLLGDNGDVTRLAANCGLDLRQLAGLLRQDLANTGKA